MDTQLEPSDLMFAISALGVILIAFSLLVSLLHLGLTSWLAKTERSLHALPVDQYLAYFAFPLLATVLGGVVNVGTGWLTSSDLEIDSYRGNAVLVTVLVAAIGAGVLAVKALVRAREKDPTDLADAAIPASMRLATADLKQRAKNLTDDAAMLDPKLLRLIAGRLERDHRKLRQKVSRLRPTSPAEGFASLRTGQLHGYAGLVTAVAAGSTVLAVTGSVVGIANGGGLLAHSAAGGLLVILAIGLWLGAAAVRAKSNTMRTRTLSDRLTTDLDELRDKLDSIPEHARGIEVAIWASNDDAAVGERLRTELGKLLIDFDILEVDRGRTVAGSWLQRLTFRSTEPWNTSKALEEIKIIVTRCLEIEALGREQLAVDQRQMDMVVKLIEALHDTKEACVIVGPIVLRKSAHGIEVRVISPTLATELANDPDLLANPAAVAERLRADGADAQPTPRTGGVGDRADAAPPRPERQDAALNRLPGPEHPPAAEEDAGLDDPGPASSSPPRRGV